MLVRMGHSGFLIISDPSSMQQEAELVAKHFGEGEAWLIPLVVLRKWVLLSQVELELLEIILAEIFKEGA